MYNSKTQNIPKLNQTDTKHSFCLSLVQPEANAGFYQRLIETETGWGGVELGGREGVGSRERWQARRILQSPWEDGEMRGLDTC